MRGVRFFLVNAVVAMGCHATPSPTAPTDAPSPAPPIAETVASMSSIEVDRARDACASDDTGAVAAPPGSAALSISFDRGKPDGTIFSECAAFSLDGRTWSHASLDESSPQTMQVFAAAVAAGSHTMRTFVAMRVRLPFCAYCYVNTYKLMLTNLHPLRTRDDHPLDVRVELFMKGGVTTPLYERPAVRVFENGIEAE